MSSTIDAASTAPASDARHDAILAHAKQIFLSQGYTATRMEAIARLARVSTATLYGFFPSKEILFDAVVHAAADDFICGVETFRPGGQSLRSRLDEFAEGYARFMGDPFVHELLRLVLAERPRFEETAARFFMRGRATFGRGLLDLIEDARARGELVCDHPSRAAGQLLGMVEHPVFTLPVFIGAAGSRPPDHQRIAVEAVETFLARYGASPQA